MFINYVCPSCGLALAFNNSFFLCQTCRQRYDIFHDIPLFNRRSAASRNPRNDSAVRQAASADVLNWERALEAFFNALPSDDARAKCSNMVFVESRAAWKYLTDLANAENALDIGCGTGISALNLCRSFKAVFAIDTALDQLLLANRMSAAKGVHNLTVVRGGDTKYLPFPSNFFDLICVNGVLERIPSLYQDDPFRDAVELFNGPRALQKRRRQSNPLRMQEQFLYELDRILKPNGTLYLAAENRFNYRSFLKPPGGPVGFLRSLFPPSLSAIEGSSLRKKEGQRSYSLSYFGLRTLLKKGNFQQSDFYSMKPDHRLFHEVIFFDKKKAPQAGPWTARERIKQKFTGSKFFCPSFGIVSRKCAGGDNFVRKVLKTISGESGRTYELNRYHVMMKGNVVLDVADVNDASSGLIIKISVDDTSESQNDKNYTVLSSLQNNDSIPVQIRRLIPRAAGKFSIDGQNIYLEEKIVGIPAGSIVHDDRVKQEVLKHALNFIVGMHQATLVKAALSEKEYLQSIGGLVERVMRAGRAGQDAFHKLDLALRRVFVGREISRALKHGDFSFANMIIDPKTHELAGVIDWDNAEYDHPILVDLINLIESTYNLRNFELGHTVTKILLNNDISLQEQEITRSYLNAFDCSEDLFVPSVLLYWLYHFDSQTKYDYLIHNPVWMKQNYYNVASAFDAML